jgi:hypothetical protein
MWHQALIGRIDKQPRLLKTRDDLLLNLIECKLRLPKRMAECVRGSRRI